MRRWWSPPAAWWSALPSRNRLQRGALLLTIVGLHLLFVLWLLRGPSSMPVARPAVSVFTITAPTGRRRAAPSMPRHVAHLPDSAVPVPMIRGRLPGGRAPAPGGVEASVAAAPAAPGCALARDAGRAIEQDPAAMAELGALPPAVRSASDAVMLWNGQWLEPGTLPATIDPGALRRVVTGVAAAAPEQCRLTATTGPEFIPVADGDRTVMIVVGSGIWQWADLVTATGDCMRAATPCSAAEQPAPDDQLFKRLQELF